MSPKFGTPGQRVSSTAQGNFSISLKNIGCQPSGCQAHDGASMPEQTVA
jgi:hypothetical protein